jgi:hypothetical protein
MYAWRSDDSWSGSGSVLGKTVALGPLALGHHEFGFNLSSSWSHRRARPRCSVLAPGLLRSWEIVGPSLVQMAQC